MAYNRTNKNLIHIKRIFRISCVCALLALVPVVKGAAPSVLSIPEVHAAGYHYAGEHTSLLDRTNVERQAAGLPPLVANSQLDAAAQAKAEDMVGRDYWSHATPDGDDPWVFISRAGYAYRTAGENLASGFTNDNDVVEGWMKSPGHRQNVMNENYTEVGFGTAASPDYQHEGPKTIVVALYATPQ